jgi:ABC-type antimicrobial peptide transport system permease subunit
VYQPYAQVNRPFFLSQMTFVVRTAANPAALAASVRGVIRETDPNQAVQSVATMTDRIAGTTAEPRFRTRVIGAFSIMAVLLSAIGIYGVLACSIAERTREIGIRMALGAANGAIVFAVVRRTLLLAVAGVALGTAGALAVTRVLETFLFEVKPNDPATYAAVAALLVSVALLAGIVPARRASTVDPLVALRYE